MKSYACYPGARTRFTAPVSGFVNPYLTKAHTDALRNHNLATKPAANILREEGAFKIQLAVPGLSKEAIKIELQEDQLIISGPVPMEAKPKFVREEFDYSGFKRSFRLQQNADTSAMTASYDQGILTIVIPDKAQATTKINIQ